MPVALDRPRSRPMNHANELPQTGHLKELSPMDVRRPRRHGRVPPALLAAAVVFGLTGVTGFLAWSLSDFGRHDRAGAQDRNASVDPKSDASPSSRPADRGRAADSDDAPLPPRDADDKPTAADATDKATAKDALPPDPFPRKIKVPPLDGGVEWLNCAAPLTLDDLRGKVVLLDFWTYCCINCMHVLPDLKKLEGKYADELVVIGVHSAKFLTEL